MIRWSVAPADEKGADGRTTAEFALDPGTSATDRFAVRNLSAEPVEFALTAGDGFFTPTGRFDILPADRPSADAGKWIALPETVRVGAGETVVVPYTLTVPERAQPGDHAAGITASVVAAREGADGATVGVESRVGFRVTARVTGSVAPKAAVQAVSGRYRTSWNPFAPGEATVAFELRNEGNTILLMTGDAAAAGASGAFPSVGGGPVELLPGDTRTLTLTIRGVWPLLLVPAEVRVQPVARTLDGAPLPVEPLRVSVLVWAVPWPQLAVLMGLSLVAGSVLWGRARSRRRLRQLLDEAREQGRASAMTDSASDGERG
jgi:hypothetical protein